MDIGQRLFTRSLGMATDKPYELGARIRLSALGKSRMMRGADRRGRVIGFGRTDAIVRVQFDEFKCPVSLHHSYVERDKRAEIEARLASSPSAAPSRSEQTSPR